MVFSFPADFASSDPNFTTLFRLLDDFDTYSREVSGSQDSSEGSHPRQYPTRIQHGSAGGGGRWGRNRRGVNPRFDIRETKDAYELYGELPGAERSDIHIELTEPNTLLIYGRVDRDYAPAPGGEEEGREEKKEEEGSGEKEEKGKEKAEGGEGGSNETEGEKKKKGGKPKEDPSVRFFLRERHVGEFAREFAFPGTLQEFDIEATLEKGILKVVAPKQQPAKGRKIEIK
ncbi:HSP20-like chaperone [Sordaria brevicollis]|uniref:HSP20-like chaperone n=1 Tax=Sordaria brevicollis TaxID=83679 RepID=A0AAE0NW17_SORBR|nr:HSP20-like chaperone [Sordaria brevicollis]